jgi:hypothetical protein
MTSQIRKIAEQLATRRLASTLGPDALRDSPHGYTYDPRDNLIYTVSEDDFWSDLEAGAGGELIETASAPPKFCAAYSSAALAVNTFGPFRHRPEQLALLGDADFQEFQFQVLLQTGAPGAAANLDAVAQSANGAICIESAFLETLNEKDARFSPAFAAAIEQVAEESWAAVYRSLVRTPRQFQHLDAAQLVRDYLGIRGALAPTLDRLTLLYLYWEPSDADQVPAFVEHRAEVNAFAEAVSGSAVRFVATSYPSLWSEWQRAESWPDAQEHVRLLTERYGFALGS